MNLCANSYLKEQALLFVTGDLPEAEQRRFELILQCDSDLRDYAASLCEAAAFLSLRMSAPATLDLKERVLAATENLSQEEEQPLVLTNPEGLVSWVNASFSEMCGYTDAELKGRKLGPLLQGEKTDAAAAQQLSQSVHQAIACHQLILNYHKTGTPYWVEIELIPVKDDADTILCFLAQGTPRRDLPIP